MKELLNYYYFIITDRIYMKDNNYYFVYQNHLFALYKYTNSIDDLKALFELNNYMIYNGYNCNKIILNKNQDILTRKENSYYVLILLNISSENRISLNNILNFYPQNIDLLLLNKTNWYSLWIEKIDYIEYTLKHFQNKYPLLYSASFYYIGLTENAISYLKYFNLKNNHIGICHRRVDCLETIVNFYNPLNFIIDYKVRDLAEYFKACFFKKKMNITMITNYLKKIKMPNIDYIYFYIRMLYPSYYFDIFDKIINNQVKEESINCIINLQNEYEYLLYEIYLVIKSNNHNFIGIDWINKKFAK